MVTLEVSSPAWGLETFQAGGPGPSEEEAGQGSVVTWRAVGNG